MVPESFAVKPTSKSMNSGSSFQPTSWAKTTLSTLSPSAVRLLTSRVETATMRSTLSNGITTEVTTKSGSSNKFEALIIYSFDHKSFFNLKINLLN
jgi:hypothetical protein